MFRACNSVRHKDAPLLPTDHKISAVILTPLRTISQALISTNIRVDAGNRMGLKVCRHISLCDGEYLRPDHWLTLPNVSVRHGPCVRIAIQKDVNLLFNGSNHSFLQRLALTSAAGPGYVKTRSCPQACASCANSGQLTECQNTRIESTRPDLSKF